MDNITLSVKDIAEILKVSEKTIYRMVQNETIPCFRVGGQWRFDRTEITSWLHDTRIYRKAMPTNRVEDEESISIAEFLRRGGIFREVPGGTREAALRACLQRIAQNIQPLDEPRLLGAILERETLCSTAVGHGIAIPHPASFGKFNDSSHIALCRLLHPIPFGAVDNEPVDTFFFIFPKSERRFLRIQAKLLGLLRDKSIVTIIKQSVSAAQIIEALARGEASWGTVAS
ncbi:MAG TPA: PTS sugar transporter subunit IIA [Dissulfurispiraceae bacterium]|nr:PTS sugar transporter subunit IIA [Dissulfurispiraceae bacterium]